MSMKCANPFCNRTAIPTTPTGSHFAYCEACTRRFLSTAFAPVERIPEWRRRAEANGLPAKDWTYS